MEIGGGDPGEQAQSAFAASIDNMVSVTEAGGADFDDYDASGTFDPNADTGLRFTISGSGDVRLGGLKPPSPNATRFAYIINTDATDKVIFNHDDSGSTAEWRFLLPNASDYDLFGASAIQIFYCKIQQRWRIIQN